THTHTHTARHTTPHTCVLAATQDTHTHTHADEVAGEICVLSFTSPGLLATPQGSQEQWAAFYFSVPGDQAKCLVQSWSGTDRERSFLFFCMFLCWGPMWRKPL